MCLQINHIVIYLNQQGGFMSVPIPDVNLNVNLSNSCNCDLFCCFRPKKSHHKHKNSVKTLEIDKKVNVKSKSIFKSKDPS